MKALVRYIREPLDAPLPSERELDALMGTCPWFVTARSVRALVRGTRAGEDPLLALHYSVSPAGMAALPVELREPSAPPLSTGGEALIDAFLAHGEYRISPPEVEGGATRDAEEPDAEALPGIVTEQLARIYASQRLWSRAKAAYEKLSLLYPEKSVYFAEIIADMERREKEQEKS